MKNWFILAAALVAVGAQAKQVGYNKLSAELKQLDFQLNDGGESRDAGGCTFQMKKDRQGMTLTLATDKKGTSVLTVLQDAKINLNSKESSDGSYSHEYTLEGGEVIEVVHADDAYDEVTLVNDKRRLTCGVYY